MIAFTIDEATPSMNVMLRKHWTADRKLKQHWTKLVWVAVHGMKPQRPYSKARITITRVSPRVLDTDNCVGSVKHLCDGLRACGIIADDTPEHVELIVRQEKGKAATRVRIEAFEK